MNYVRLRVGGAFFKGRGLLLRLGTPVAAEASINPSAATGFLSNTSRSDASSLSFYFLLDENCSLIYRVAAIPVLWD